MTGLAQTLAQSWARLAGNTAKIGSGRQRQPLRLKSQARLRCASSQRPCSWKSPLYEFEVPASYGPASTGLAMIDRAATAARMSLVMAVAPSRVGPALGSVPGFSALLGKCFSTCEFGVAEPRENEGERSHTAKAFSA